MAYVGMCPYLKDARNTERTICECARFTFPDKISRRELLYGYCGHPSAWKECTFKSILDRFYDRKYSLSAGGNKLTDEERRRALFSALAAEKERSRDDRCDKNGKTDTKA